jgi:hypothetical protein
MTKIKSREEIKDILLNDFGIRNISGKPIITTTEKDVSDVSVNALPSIYYRLEIEYKNHVNNAYVIFALALNQVKSQETFSYNKNTINVINFSQNPKRSVSSPQFEIELKENNIDQYFQIIYRQFHKNLENDQFENLFSDKELKTLKTAFFDLDSIFNKTKKQRQNLGWEVDVDNYLKTFSIDPSMFTGFNLLDLQKACSLFLEARYGVLKEYTEENSDLETLANIDWSRLYNTYTTKNIAISYLNKFETSESIEIKNELLLALYFTIIKELNTTEENIFRNTLKNLNVNQKELEKELYSKIDSMKQDQRIARRAEIRKREYKFEINSVTNPKLNKTRDALLYIEVLLRLISKSNTINQDLLLQRSLDMYLRTKFARFKQDGYINNSKNGPRYTLESKGQDLLTK